VAEREAPDDVLETLLGEETMCLLEPVGASSRTQACHPGARRGAQTLARRVGGPALLVAGRMASAGLGWPDLADIRDLDELTGPMAMSSSPRVTRLGWWRTLAREKADDGE
jgi:hypothetical protein